jgi:hypothetical protein
MGTGNLMEHKVFFAALKHRDEETGTRNEEKHR